MAGRPKRSTVLLSAWRPRRANLKRLLRQWTTAVKAMAASMGKKRAITGSNSVPRPKPENSVRPEAKKAQRQIMR